MGKQKSKAYVFLGPNKTEYIVSNEILKKAVSYIHSYRKCKSEVKKGSCTFGSTLRSLRHTRGQLRTRQLPDIGHGLRVALLKHQWNEAVYLTQFLTLAGISRYTSAIVRTCFYLLLNHPKSSHELLEDFIGKCTGYDLPNDIRKFIKILFAIRKEPVAKLHKYSSAKLQIVNDIIFNNL